MSAAKHVLQPRGVRMYTTGGSQDKTERAVTGQCEAQTLQRPSECKDRHSARGGGWGWVGVSNSNLQLRHCTTSPPPPPEKKSVPTRTSLSNWTKRRALQLAVAPLERERESAVVWRSLQLGRFVGTGKKADCHGIRPPARDGLCCSK